MSGITITRMMRSITSYMEPACLFFSQSDCVYSVVGF